LLPSVARGVFQPASWATSCKSAPPAPLAFRWLFGPPVGVLGVGQPTTVCATWLRLTVALLPSGLRPVVLASFAICEPSALPFVGVGQPATVCAITCSDVIAFRPPPIRFFIAKCASGDLLSSFATGVGHPPKPLSDMRAADRDPSPLERIIFEIKPSFGFLARARSAQIGGPDSISHCFQVSTYSGEPLAPIL